VSVRTIVQLGDPVLRVPAQPLDPADVGSPAVQRLIDDLIETMRAANGAGLAAPQVGEGVQVCVIEVRPNNPRYPYKPEIGLTVLVNPVVEPLTEESFANYEGCLSVPGLRGVVDRFVEVRVTGLERDGTPVERVVTGLSAGTFQHETDHLRGMVFLDRVTVTRTLRSRLRRTGPGAGRPLRQLRSRSGRHRRPKRPGRRPGHFNRRPPLSCGIFRGSRLPSSPEDAGLPAAASPSRGRQWHRERSRRGRQRLS
jgi:peptide deformylase